jgi:hypothetical protein
MGYEYAPHGIDTIPLPLERTTVSLFVVPVDLQETDIPSLTGRNVGRKQIKKWQTPTHKFTYTVFLPYKTAFH